MQSKLSKVGTKIGYIDFEQPLLDVIQNPKEYGQWEILVTLSIYFLGKSECPQFNLLKQNFYQVLPRWTMVAVGVDFMK